MYLPEIDTASGKLMVRHMPVFRSHKFSLRNAADRDVAWLAGVLDEHSRRLDDTRVEKRAGEL